MTIVNHTGADVAWWAGQSALSHSRAHGNSGWFSELWEGSRDRWIRSVSHASIVRSSKIKEIKWGSIYQSTHSLNNIRLMQNDVWREWGDYSYIYIAGKCDPNPIFFPQTRPKSLFFIAFCTAAIWFGLVFSEVICFGFKPKKKSNLCRFHMGY